MYGCSPSALSNSEEAATGHPASPYGATPSPRIRSFGKEVGNRIGKTATQAFLY